MAIFDNFTYRRKQTTEYAQKTYSDNAAVEQVYYVCMPPVELKRFIVLFFQRKDWHYE